MEKKRNGLVEIYRLFFCLWVMYYHNVFLFREGREFSCGYLGVEFFFVLSGFFLVESMRKSKELPLMKGAGRVVGSRFKTMAMPLMVVVPFNLLCTAIFFWDNFFDTFVYAYSYLWFVYYLLIAVFVFYLIYRWIKNEKGFFVFLCIFAVVSCIIHFSIGAAIDDYSIWFLYPPRTAWTMSLGMLMSYIPRKPWKCKNFNLCILFIPILAGIILYLAYLPKTDLIRFSIVFLSAVLIYISMTVNVGGKFFECIGQLSVRMYIYSAVLCILDSFGLSDCRILFVIDFVLANLDLYASRYYKKWKLFAKKMIKFIKMGIPCMR